MVEFRYFNKEYKKVVNKTFSDTIVFLKIIGMTIVITLLFMFITMEKDGDERYIGSYRIYEAEIEQQEDDYGS